MNDPHNFDPYFDFDNIEPKLAKELARTWTATRDAAHVMADDPTPENVGNYLRHVQKYDGVFEKVKEDIFVVPVMVHVAGETKDEVHPDGDPEIPEHHATVQRCSRCGTMLHIWHPSMVVMGDEGPEHVAETDTPFWPKGTVVGKSHDEDDLLARTTMYQIEDRDLEPHERECVDLSGLDG